MRKLIDTSVLMILLLGPAVMLSSFADRVEEAATEESKETLAQMKSNDKSVVIVNTIIPQP